MEKGDIHCSLGEEVRGLNISIGIEQTKYNGNRERFEPIKLVKTMGSLKMEVQSCKVDIERMIRAQ